MARLRGGNRRVSDDEEVARGREEREVKKKKKKEGKGRGSTRSASEADELSAHVKKRKKGNFRKTIFFFDQK